MDLQEIFTVTFSILYGIMLNSCIGLGLFHFGWLWKREDREPFVPKQRNVTHRLVVSIILFNIFPYVYFSYILLLLSNYNHLSFQNILGTFFLSLGVFMFYRIFHVILSFKNGREWLYDMCHPAIKFLNNRLNREMGHSTKGQSLSVVFYFILIIIGLYLIDLEIIRNIFIHLIQLLDC